MDELFFDTTDVSAALDSHANDLAPPPLSKRCGALSVEYLPRLTESGQEVIRDEIAILIPGDQTSFYITCQAADGRRQRAFLRAPRVSVIPAKQPHVIDCQRQSDALVITLDPAFVEKHVRETLSGATPTLVARYAALDPFLREIGATLLSEFRMSKLPSVAYLESLATVLAIHLASHYSAKRPPSPPQAGLPSHKLNRVEAFIREHLDETIEVKQLAALVHMSPYHFARMFKKATGESPHAYLTRQRMEHAKELLKDTDLPLVDVAARVGYQTQGHFTETFHKYAGVTPRIFRLNCQAVRSLERLRSFDALGAGTRRPGKGDCHVHSSNLRYRSTRSPADEPRAAG